jgi:hypothetical protein
VNNRDSYKLCVMHAVLYRPVNWLYKAYISQAISAAKHLCFSFTVIQAGCRMPSHGLGLLCSNSL